MECVKWILNGFAPFTKGMFFLKARLFIHFFAGNVGQYLVYFDRNFKLKYNEILVFFYIQSPICLHVIQNTCRRV